jgi:hypothetical protein
MDSKQQIDAPLWRQRLPYFSVSRWLSALFIARSFAVARPEPGELHEELEALE